MSVVEDEHNIQRNKAAPVTTLYFVASGLIAELSVLYTRQT